MTIRLNVTMPVTSIALGPMKFDPVVAVLGAPLHHILEPLMVGPTTRRPSKGGASVDVVPIALPDGQGIAIPVAHFGEIGFRNHHGVLVLTVPLMAAPWVRTRLADHILEENTVDGVTRPGAVRVAEFHVRLRRGMRAALPLGMFGELGIEAA